MFKLNSIFSGTKFTNAQNYKIQIWNISLSEKAFK